MKSFTAPLSEIDQKGLQANAFLWGICLLGNTILLPVTINFLADFNLNSIFEEGFLNLVLIFLFGGITLLVFVRFFILINTAPYKFFFFRKDRKNGIKTIVQDVVLAKKKSHQLTYQLFKVKIGEEWFDFKKQEWDLVEEGQAIQVEYLPVSRFVLKVEVLESKGYAFSMN